MYGILSKVFTHPFKTMNSVVPLKFNGFVSYVLLANILQEHAFDLLIF